MNKQQQPISFSKLIEKLRNEYEQLKERVCSLHSFLCDIDFEKRVPDPVEQRLMREQLHMMFGYMDNLRARISYQEEQQLRQMIEQSIPHAPMASVEKRGGDIIIHHCGQDACRQVDDGNAVVDKPIITGESLEQLVGATVRLFHKPGHKCIDCPYSSKNYGGKCEYKKVELVGGYYLCLADLPNSIVTE